EDGIIGPKTMAAIAQFQQQNNLTPVTGLLGAATIAAITRQAAPGQQQQPVPQGQQPLPQQQQPQLQLPVPIQPPLPAQVDLSPILQRIEDLQTQIQSGKLNLQTTDPLTLLQKVLAMVPLNAGQKPALVPTTPTTNDQLSQVIKVLNVILGQDGAPALGQVNGALGDTIGNLLNGKKSALGIGGSLLTALLMSVPTDAGAVAQGGALIKMLAPIVGAVPGLGQVALPVFLAIGAWGALGKLEK